MDAAELAKKIKVPKGTLQNYLGQSRSGPKLETLYLIADACDVPRSFMEHGFGDPADIANRVAELERTVTEHGSEMASLRAALRSAGIAQSDPDQDATG